MSRLDDNDLRVQPPQVGVGQQAEDRAPTGGPGICETDSRRGANDHPPAHQRRQLVGPGPRRGRRPDPGREGRPDDHHERPGRRAAGRRGRDLLGDQPGRHSSAGPRSRCGPGESDGQPTEGHGRHTPEPASHRRPVWPVGGPRGTAPSARLRPDQALPGGDEEKTETLPRRPAARRLRAAARAAVADHPADRGGVLQPGPPVIRHQREPFRVHGSSLNPRSLYYKLYTDIVICL